MPVDYRTETLSQCLLMLFYLGDLVTSYQLSSGLHYNTCPSQVVRAVCPPAQAPEAGSRLEFMVTFGIRVRFGVHLSKPERRDHMNF